MKYYNLGDLFASTSVNRDLPLLFAPLFQSLKRYTYHFLSFINQRCQILCLYTTNSSSLAALFQEKKNLILLIKSLTTVFSVQASKPLCEDPSRGKTEQHIKEQQFYRNLEFVHQEVQELSKEQWTPGVKRGAQQARGKKRNTVINIHLSATC